MRLKRLEIVSVRLNWQRRLDIVLTVKNNRMAKSIGESMSVYAAKTSRNSSASTAALHLRIRSLLAAPVGEYKLRKT